MSGRSRFLQSQPAPLKSLLNPPHTLRRVPHVQTFCATSANRLERYCSLYFVQLRAAPRACGPVTPLSAAIMGRKLKRGKAGNAAQYLTRTRAIRKLQLRLSEFRRLCILKGIHPREPKKKVHGANKTYYHVKDINWLMHEPLLQVFRNMKVHERKIRKAHAKFNPELAARLKQLTPSYKLDHLVKERYPHFVDALRDLDDALTMVHLFATLPAEKRLGIPTKVIETAKRLVLEWSTYVVKSHTLRKTFVSVKGIYFQAEVGGQAVTWLVPHQLAQVLPTDVDYKVMLTFLEFYETLLQFVLFKLYHTIEVQYPPVLNPQLEEAAAGLAAVMLQLAGIQKEEAQAADMAEAALKSADKTSKPTNKQVTQRLQALDAAKIAELAGEVDVDANGEAAKPDAANGHATDSDQEEEEEDSEAELEIDSGDDGSEDGEGEDDEEEEGEEEDGQGANGLLESEDGAQIQADADGDDNMQLADEAVAGGTLGVNVDDEAEICKALFKGLTFFLAREVPREPLALIIRAFGGTAAWDGEGSPCGPSDESITHQVVDRPTQGHKFLARQYVQPQWVLDCANFRVLLPSHLYAPGKAPPPHLSPFVNDEEEGYTPDWAQQVKKYQEAAKAARARASGLALPEGFAEEAAVEAAEGPTAAAGTTAEEDVHMQELQHQADLAKELRASQKRGREEDGEGEEEGEGGEEESDGEGEGEEIEAGEEEVAGAASLKKQRAQVAKTKAQEVADAELLKDVMMTRKNRKLYERINRAREGKRQRIEVLHERKVALQQQQQGDGKAKAGKAARK